MSAALSYLALILNRCSAQDFWRALKHPPREISKEMLQPLLREYRKGATKLEACARDLLAHKGAGDDGLSSKARSSLEAFLQLLQDLRELPQVNGAQHIPTILEALADRLGYRNDLSGGYTPEHLTKM